MSLGFEVLSKIMIEVRRRIHAHPEIGLHLPSTQRVITQHLDQIDVPYTVGNSLSSVVGVIEGATPGPTVILRADMDALPLTEIADVSFRSRIEGVMHACGHDMHVAMLLGAATMLAEKRHEFRGRVVLMFQPGEEGYGGAHSMIEEGVLGDGATQAIAAYALHVMAAPWQCGVFSVGSGPIMAAADRIDVHFRGEGGHAAAPQLAGDALGAAAAATALELRSAVARSHDPFASVVCNVGELHAGTAPNIIPVESRLSATLRTFDMTDRSRALDTIAQVSENAARMHSAEAEVTVTPRYEPTVNDIELARRSFATLAANFPGRVQELDAPTLGSEDFGSVLSRVPGAMIFLGASVDGSAGWNHSPGAMFDESVLMDGAEAFVALACQHLSV